MLQQKTVEQSTLELLKELMRIAELKEFKSIAKVGPPDIRGFRLIHR